MTEQTLSKTTVTPPVKVKIPKKRQLAYVLLAAVAILALTYVLPPFRNYQLATVGAYLCVTAGLTVLIADEQLALARHADRVVLVEHGELVLDAERATALADPRLGVGYLTERHRL